MKFVIENLDDSITHLVCYSDDATDTPDEVQEGDAINEVNGSLMVDMTNVEFIKSNEIGWLLQRHRESSQNDRKVILHSVSDFTLKTLQMMKLDDVFEITQSADDAKRILCEAAADSNSGE